MSATASIWNRRQFQSQSQGISKADPRSFFFIDCSSWSALLKNNSAFGRCVNVVVQTCPVFLVLSFLWMHMFIWANALLVSLPLGLLKRHCGGKERRYLMYISFKCLDLLSLLLCFCGVAVCFEVKADGWLSAASRRPPSSSFTLQGSFYAVENDRLMTPGIGVHTNDLTLRLVCKYRNMSSVILDAGRSSAVKMRWENGKEKEKSDPDQRDNGYLLLFQIGWANRPVE